MKDPQNVKQRWLQVEKFLKKNAQRKERKRKKHALRWPYQTHARARVMGKAEEVQE